MFNAWYNLSLRTFDILITEKCFVNRMSCLTYSNNSMCFKNAKHCALNTLDLKISQWIADLRPYGFELLEG